MLALIKIRCRYLSNNCCSVYWNYFFIPSITFISLIIFLEVNKFNSEIHEHPKTQGQEFKITKELFSKNISYNKYYFSLVSNDKEDKTIFEEIMNSSIEWSTQESGIKNNNNIIKIINKNKRYNIELIIRNTTNTTFYTSSLSSFKFYDPFQTNFEFIYYRNEVINNFIELQSLFAQFLIKKKKEGINYFQKKLIMEFGLNYYPSYIFFVAKIPAFLANALISFQFTITSYFFCMRMIDEKEKKLTKFLERKGISKKNYFFSWLFPYLLIIIPTLIIYIISYHFLYPFHISLFIINLILFAFSLYLFTFFLFICISKSQTGSILIKLINLTSSILGMILYSENFPRLLKIFAGIIPQINIYYCTYSIEKLLTFKQLSWEVLCLKARKISYMNSIIMDKVEIILYSLLSFIIVKFRQSGLGFFDFSISCCKKVSRKISQKREDKIDEKVLKFETHFQDLSSFNILFFFFFRINGI